MTFKTIILAGCGVAALGGTAHANEAPAEAAPAAPADAAAEIDQTASEIVVTGTLVYRNRTDDPNPVLSYDSEYFQRFEPVSVGEMLKRVPGVTFTSDVLEYDGVQMRGLPPGFTQVLINGRRAPGGEADRSFFVDRIPAELIERIEIVRAPRADQPSEGVAGTLNIITREAATFEGGTARIGALINEDGGIRPSASVAYADRVGDISFWGALNYQERRNPKLKVSDRFSGEFEEFDNRELQEDTRDGSDLSANAEVSMPILGTGNIRITGLLVDTDRDEDETSLTFEGEELELDEVEIQRERISQQTYALSSDARLPLAGGELGLAAGWSAYRDDTRIFTDEGSDLDDVELVERETLDIQDDQYSGTVSYTFGSDALRFKAGIDLLRSERDGANRVFEIEDGEEEEEEIPGAIFSIRENRYDPYARVTFEPASSLSIDAGLRYEITRRNVTSDGGGASYSEESLNPSLHLRYRPSGRDQFRASVARTVRRPGYDLISPYTQEESPADEDETIGNPALRNERAWGLDVGYERRLGANGIFGVNFFYRDIDDLIELVDTGDEADAGGQVFQPRNIGSGRTWGFEADLSTPLTVIGMPDTGLFANYTWLDSSTRDPFTGQNRRFQNQPRHVYNVGFIQTLTSLNSSFGASISGRSRARESNLDETVELSYGQDLEAFVEHRFGENFVLRLSGSNLLNRAKREVFRTYDGDSVDEILDNRLEGNVDESERERERSGRLFQVTLRAAF